MTAVVERADALLDRRLDELAFKLAKAMWGDG
jgi:hypothetical protein